MGIKIECENPNCRSKKRRFTIEKKACPACGLLVKHFQNKRYWIEYIDPDGRKVREKIKGESLNAARYRWRAVQQGLAENRYIPRDRSKELSLGDLFDWYTTLPEVSNLKSFKQAKEHLRTVVARMGRNVKVCSLTRGTFESYQYNRLSTPSLSESSEMIKPSSVNVELARLKALFNRAVAHGRIQTNPMQGVRRLKIKTKRERHLEPEEFERLVACCEEPYKSWVVLGYYTGMRREEIVGLRWDEINLEGRMIHLPAQRTKTCQARDVPIHHSRLLALLENTSRGTNIFVFEKHGKKPWFINKTFRKYCRQSGIEDFHFHDLRHSAVSNFSRSGLDWLTIKKMVGHDSDLMFYRYNHRTIRDLKNVYWFDEIDTHKDTPAF